MAIFLKLRACRLLAFYVGAPICTRCCLRGMPDLIAIAPALSRAPRVAEAHTDDMRTCKQRFAAGEMHRYAETCSVLLTACQPEMSGRSCIELKRT